MLILCLAWRTTVTSACITQEDACYRARHFCVSSRVKKGTPGLTHKGCVQQRVYFGVLSGVTVVLGVRQSIVCDSNISCVRNPDPLGSVRHWISSMESRTGQQNIIYPLPFCFSSMGEHFGITLGFSVASAIRNKQRPGCYSCCLRSCSRMFEPCPFMIHNFFHMIEKQNGGVHYLLFKSMDLPDEVGSSSVKSVMCLVFGSLQKLVNFALATAANTAPCMKNKQTNENKCMKDHQYQIGQNIGFNMDGIQLLIQSGQVPNVHTELVGQLH